MEELKQQIRPTISSIIVAPNMSSEETFQNSILRPIIKLQHNLILAYFEQYLKVKKTDFKALTTIEKKEMTQTLFKTENRLKTELRSLIVAMFTLEEYNDYLSQSTQLNKRINSIIEQRIISCY